MHQIIVLAVLAAVAVADYPAKHFFAPYVDVTLPSAPVLSEYMQASGVRYVTLAFIICKDSNTCESRWGTVYDVPTGPPGMYDDLLAVQAMGGDYIVSFGGAAGYGLQQACLDVPSLKLRYEEAIDATHAKYLDMDIEHTQLWDTVALDRMMEALAQIASERVIKYSLTAAAMPDSGITWGYQFFLDKWVKYERIVLMTMDYGQAYNKKPQYQYAQDCIMKTLPSLMQHGLTEAEAYTKQGICPMIGDNDLPENEWLLSDSAAIVDWALLMDVGEIRMWSVTRDHPCHATEADPTCSGTCPDGNMCQSGDWQYSQSLLPFNTGSPISMPSLPTPLPSSNPLPSIPPHSSVPAHSSAPPHSSIPPPSSNPLPSSHPSNPPPSAPKSSSSALVNSASSISALVSLVFAALVCFF